MTDDVDDSLPASLTTLVVARAGLVVPTCRREKSPVNYSETSTYMNYLTNKTGDVLSCYMQRSSIHYTLLCIHSSHDTTLTV